MLVEVCANSLESALNAERAGADRIELCSELAVGGITPSHGLLKVVREKVSIPVRVLIRPRSGDFTYSDDELDIMKRDIKFCSDLGYEGIVSGVLRSNFLVDEHHTKVLMEAASDLKFTFHRAFDWVQNPLEALDILQNMGVDTLLTSGQQKCALEGAELLEELQKHASNCTIMPGSGINTDNAHTFKEKGFRAIHLSGVKMNKRLKTKPTVGMNSPKMLSDDSVPISNFETVQAVIKAVK